MVFLLAIFDFVTEDLWGYFKKKKVMQSQIILVPDQSFNELVNINYTK